TVVNVSLLLVQLEWNGFGISYSVWTLIILAVAIAFVLIYLTKYKNAAYPLPLAWAFFGIYGSYASGRVNPALATAIQGFLIGGIVSFLIAAVSRFTKNGNSLVLKHSN